MIKNIINNFFPYKNRRKIRKGIDIKFNNLKLKFNLIHSFKGVKCPYCNNYFKEFNTFGSPHRNNAQCPVCKSLERHRMIFLFLTEKKMVFSKKTNIHLLHVAPEKCMYDKIKHLKKINYYPFDLHPDYYYYLNGPALIQGDLTKTSFEAEKFDFIFCNHVLEHIPDDAKAMSELYRILKNKGKGIFLVPIDNSLSKTYEDFSITAPEEREIAFGQDDHVRLYGNDYVDRLANAGFKVSVIDYKKTLSKRDQFKYGLLDNELIYFVEK